MRIKTRFKLIHKSNAQKEKKKKSEKNDRAKYTENLKHKVGRRNTYYHTKGKIK